VREGQKEGTVDPSVDPGDLLLFIVALAILPTAAPQVARQFTGKDPDDPNVRARYRASLVEAVRRIVTPPPG
jgi:hypothetical protein